MKAIRCTHFGPASELTYVEDAPRPTLDVSDGFSASAEHNVLIRVVACSVNFPDTLMIQGKYQIKPALPFSPGSDVSGVIEEVGSKVRHLKVGQEVVALAPYGGLAEYLTVAESMCIPKPAGLDWGAAAAFAYTYGTSLHALRGRANLQASETLLVLGAAGGVGLAAVELGVMMGARVIAAASTDAKRALCKKYGAEVTIDYTKVDLKAELKRITEGKGVDVIFDPVGGEFTEPALRSMGWEGRYLVIGFAAGDIAKIPLNLPLLKGCDIRGVFFGAFAKRDPRGCFAMLNKIGGLIQAGTLKPHIDATYALKDAAKAVAALANREVLGKVVVEV